jgi:hypothetical protein
VDHCASCFASWPNSKIGLTGAYVKTTRLCDSFRRFTCFTIPLIIHCPDLLVAAYNVARTVRLLVNTWTTWPYTHADNDPEYTALTTIPSPTLIEASVAV